MSNPSRPTKEWTLWQLDVWGNQEEGWDVNNRFKVNIVDLPEDPTDRDIMVVLKEAGQLKETAKVSDLSIDGDEDLLMIDDAKTGEPLWTLETIKGTEQPEEMIRSNTGEPDQDYDHEFFDAIVRQLAKAGFKDSSHRQFDQYQGVYLSVPGVDKFWIVDSYFSGEKEREPGIKWKSSQLIDPDGNQVSSSRGDYFMEPKTHVFVGYLLRLMGFDGKWKEIENPTVGDLPDLLEVQRSIKYKKGTRVQVVIFQGEYSGQTASVTSTEDGTVDASKLVALCRKIRKG